MAGTDPISSTKPKPFTDYPVDDAAKKTADGVEQKTSKDGLKVTSATYDDVIENESASASAVKATKFLAVTAYEAAKVASPANWMSNLGSAMDTANEAIEKLEKGDVKGAVEVFARRGISVTAEALQEQVEKGGPASKTFIIVKAIEGTHALVKTFNAAKEIGKADNDLKAQVWHNERAKITHTKYLLDKGMISQHQYDEQLSSMSPQARQFAKGNGSLDERVATFKADAAKTGADKQIEADFRRGEAAAVKYGIKTPGDLMSRLVSDKAFAHAYATNLSFHAAVDSMVDKYANDRPAYDARVKAMSLPTCGPVAC